MVNLLMLNENIIFYLFSIFLVFSAFMVVVSQHPVFSLLFLVSSFIFASFILLLLECELLALLFIIVYVGAIAVLFLFAIMMLESKLTDLSRSVMRYVPIGLIFAVVLLFPQLREISSNFDKNMYYDLFYQNSFQNWYDLVDSTTDVEVYGQVLYSYFVLQLLIAGLILLLVLIGVVYLTNNFNVSKQTRDQATFKQLARTTKFFYK
jgi:NADH-quinone oxidoreductase subunit J